MHLSLCGVPLRFLLSAVYLVPGLGERADDTCRFVNAEGPDGDKLRNQKFKLIPNIPKGSWLIRQSVGTTPVLLGQKLTTNYYRCGLAPWISSFFCLYDS
jgi:hypothetical protein